jgi:dipeptidyl aminopeptidase/acylaminoacyl peptidase
MQKEEALNISEDYPSKIIGIEDLRLLKLSKNGKRALFISSRSGSYQLWSKDLESGTVAQISHGSDRVELAEIFKDSKRVLFPRDFAGSELHQFFIAGEEGEEEEEKQISNIEGIRVADFEISPSEDRFAFAGATKDSNAIYLYYLKTNEYGPLCEMKNWLFSPTWRPDSKLIAAFGRTTEAPTAFELLFIDPDSRDAKKIYTPKEGSENTSPRWHSSANKVLFKTNAQNIESYDLAIYDLDLDKVEFLGLSKLGFEFPDYGWMHKKEDSVWFLATKNGRTRLYVRKADGALNALPVPDGTISKAALDEEDKFFAFSWSGLSSPPRISKLDLEGLAVSDLYKSEYDRSLPLGDAEFLTYRSFDGLEIASFLVRSKRYGKGKGPSVVWVHGGPWWEVADEWNPAIQAIAASGFHVMCPNIRGSTGYGAKFQYMDIKDAGGADLRDVLSAADYIRTHDVVVDGKLAIAGASYGGFMTFLVMTKAPDAFKAGAAIVGITDWEEMYYLSDAAFRSFIEMLFGGRPEGENLALYKDRSAINFVSELRNPIFIWHRANDSRCPLGPIQKFVERVKELGRPYEFHVMESEGHGRQKVENLAKQYSAVVSFLRKEIGS